MKQIPYDALVDLVEGRLAEAEAMALRARIAADPSAQDEVAALTELLTLMREDDSVDAPEHVIQRALRLAPRATSRPVEMLRRLVANLIQDSWRAPQLAAGLRAGERLPRSLLLRAEDRELDLQITPSGEQWQLTGQVLGPEAPGTATLSGPDGDLSISLNELGEFAFPTLGAGRYTLTLRHDDLEISVPELEIGPETTE